MSKEINARQLPKAEALKRIKAQQVPEAIRAQLSLTVGWCQFFTEKFQNTTPIFFFGTDRRTNATGADTGLHNYMSN